MHIEWLKAPLGRLNNLVVGWVDLMLINLLFEFELGLLLPSSLSWAPFSFGP